MYIFYINFTRGLCNVLHIYVLSNLNQEKNSLYLIKGKTYTSKKKIKSEISKSVYSNILKDKKIMIETSALFEFIVNMQEKKKNKEILLATHQDLLKISRLCQDRQNT